MAKPSAKLLALRPLFGSGDHKTVETFVEYCMDDEVFAFEYQDAVEIAAILGLVSSLESFNPKIAEMYGILVNELKVQHEVVIVSVESINDMGIGESVPPAWLQAGEAMEKLLRERMLSILSANLTKTTRSRHEQDRQGHRH